MIECSGEFQPLETQQRNSLEYKIFSDAQSLFVYDQASVDRLYNSYNVCFKKHLTEVESTDSHSVNFLYALDKMAFYLSVFRQLLRVYILIGSDKKLKDYIESFK